MTDDGRVRAVEAARRVGASDLGDDRIQVDARAEGETLHVRITCGPRSSWSDADRVLAATERVDALLGPGWERIQEAALDAFTTADGHTLHSVIRYRAR
jgi:hypothetical protein